MQVKNNPAGRLHDILAEARKRSPKESCRKVWAEVFGVDAGDTAVILKMVAALINLVDEAKDSIKRVENIDHNLHLRVFAKIEALLSRIHLDASWESWRSQIDDVMLHGLQFSSDVLSRLSGASSLSAEDLESIRGNIDDLIEEVLDSDIEHDLKTLLLRNLESMRQSLIAYRVNGLDGIQRELERSYGSILLHREVIRASKPAERRIWEVFFLVVDRINKLVALGRSTQALGVPAVSFLLEKLKN